MSSFSYQSFWVDPTQILSKTVLHSYMDTLQIIKQACYGLSEHLWKREMRPLKLSHLPWKGYLSSQKQSHILHLAKRTLQKHCFPLYTANTCAGYMHFLYKEK